ncbi:thioredoxin-like domain-containing protein [Haliscomenobacter sp.]|uniref:thioredoxin-like domain-containing protein n=1 Tax=Haliscomenobacter sp. TaxID=2717303 RepID=UPI00359368DF
MKKYFLSLFASLLITSVFAQTTAKNAYQIRVKIDGFTEKQLFLGYYMGDKQYVMDTALVDAKGEFVFSGPEALKGGMYIVVLPPSNDFFQVLVTDKEQSFFVRTTKDKPGENVKFEGSKENSLFYDYVNYLNAKRPEAEALGKEIAEAKDNQAAKDAAQKKMDKLNEDVEKYQKDYVVKYKGTFAAAIINANINVEPPKTFDNLAEEEKNRQLWLWTRKHFFDNLNLSDNRLLRTPFLFSRLDNYVNKLSVQHPDSISVAIDTVLERLRPADEAFKYYLIHFLNSFAASKFVGMDAVYVHMSEKYYATGQANWANQEQVKKIVDNAKKLKPLLIGKTAPDIVLERNGARTMLSQLKSEYTLLYFWRYDCGHCKESMPAMKKFFEKFKDKGITLVAICVKPAQDQPECLKYIQENGLTGWYNAFDPTGRYYVQYNVETTPQMYILDNKKEIISKQVPADQLEDVMDKIIEMNKKEKENAGNK